MKSCENQSPIHGMYTDVLHSEQKWIYGKSLLSFKITVGSLQARYRRIRISLGVHQPDSLLSQNSYDKIGISFPEG